MKEISISSIDGIKIGHAVDKVHGIVLSRGSAFGLDASTGVMERSVLNVIKNAKSHYEYISFSDLV
ncbi:hypothetical protein K144316041_06870 [Clostridium tetani]|uniref:Uncharacterized protein n=1 Tax=Clostridium tetani TaxID=1513 RepID=A0A4Q0VGL0_CLOTA|nr:hypothetical protein [Clostridium tetani]RXI50469.1 hypothetical protein DP130_00415 [Clostridium tetani]BDR63770.1 hypothetical protein K134307016_07040 [Clostridium tetani]BDR66477.1 hypothetical protein K144312032_07050 [Clostridium tetani]BDR71979.1 hypothetical protein K144316041_06870 [Clostridium tetani]BDR80453.1 hypothetical protein K234311028_06990 [Clostridium tetani]